ncbi:MAG: CD225/dispanin family protein [Fimbriimonadaceae bacterium]|nr:CD225/dispanin family protein [Fimbriimonadaceae bacterium]
MRYYVTGDDGQRYGPADVPTLNAWAREGRLVATTRLVEEGTERSVFAAEVPGLSFGAPSEFRTPPTGGPTYQTAPSGTVDNHLVKSILVTLCCCLPLGIAAIVFSSQVNPLVQSGRYAEAQEKAAQADKWANWGIGLGIVTNLVWLAANFATLGLR